MYHHSDRKNRLFFIGYIPIQSIRFCIPKLPCGGRPCSRIISHLQCLQVQWDLHFRMGQFWDVKLPIDHTDLKYWPHFLTSSTGGTTFPDLTWTIPMIMNSASDLVPTLFACRTINKGISIQNWLILLLQHVL